MDDLLFQCLVLCIACIIVYNGRGRCHAVDDGGIRELSERITVFSTLPKKVTMILAGSL